jgi:hypothetical protein
MLGRRAQGTVGSALDVGAYYVRRWPSESLVELVGSERIGIDEGLAQDVAGAKEQLALLSSELVLVVERLGVEALGGVALSCLQCPSSVLDRAVEGRKQSGFTAPYSLGALLGTGVNVGVWPVLLARTEVGVAIGWLGHLEQGESAETCLEAGRVEVVSQRKKGGRHTR